MKRASAGGAAYSGKYFTIDGKPTFLFSGEFHYFRTPRALWADRLLKCRRLLLNTVASYIPWNWHERLAGSFDFQGEREIGHFIDAAAPLYFFARPGPYICAEWDSGSVPQWLQQRTRHFRTLDPRFLERAQRWYEQVNSHVASRLRSRGGNVVLYQVENEDWWCDSAYDLALYRIAREHGIDCPIVTNENPRNRGTELIDTLDDYPLPWQPNSPYMFIPDGMEGKIRRLLETQPDKPPMHTEFETGWYQEFGHPAPSKWLGDVPAAWVEVLLKSVIAQGVNAINMYMAAGGSNPGYWGSKGCTTTRDWIAPIREWGALNDSFYAVRRVAGLVETFGTALVQTEVDHKLVKDRDERISVFARRGEEGIFLCPRSLSAESAQLRFRVPDVPGLGTVEFPGGSPYQLRGHSAAVLPVNVELGTGIPRLIYSTAEIFRVFRSPRSLSVIAHAPVGREVELALLGRPPVSGGGQVEVRDGRTVLSCVVSESPTVFRLELAPEVLIVVVDSDTAGRTWEIVAAGGSVPLISNLYLLREQTGAGDWLRLAAESQPDAEVRFWIPGAELLQEVEVNGEAVPVTRDRNRHLAAVTFRTEPAPEVRLPLAGPWRAAPAAEGECLSDLQWSAYRPWEGVERHALYDNGYFWYRTAFQAPDHPMPLTLRLSRFVDEASAFLNGTWVGSGRNRLQAEVSSEVKFGGENELVICTECWGRWEHGFPEETGLVGPVTLDAGREVVELRHWKRRQAVGYDQPWTLPDSPPEAAPGFDESEFESIRVERNWDSRIHGAWRHKDYYWYRTTVAVPKSFAGKRLCLEIGGARDDCWLYVNGRLMRWLNWFRLPGEPFAVDVTGSLRPGEENTVAVLVLVKWHGQGGLHGWVDLAAYRDLLSGAWQLAAGLPGLRRRYETPELDDSGWRVMAAGKAARADPESASPSEPGFPSGSHDIHWFRTTFETPLNPGWKAPLGLTVQGFERKANLYLNGHFLGRYRSEGPQEWFYVPESYLRSSGANNLALAVDGFRPGLRFGTVQLQSRDVTRELDIRVRL